MGQSQYNVVFYGKIVAGQEIQTVKRRLSKLFQASEQQIDALFTGKPVIIKANVEQHTALRYKTAFEKAGAMCRLEPVQDDTIIDQPPLSQPKPQAPANQSQLYDVMFSGQILEGSRLSEVKQRLTKLFRTDANTIEHMFTGKPTLIKARINQQTALQYKTLMERAGAVCQLVPHQPNSATVAPDDQKPQPTQSSELPTCPKCQYQATSPSDPLITGMGGLGECPSCGIIVANYRKTVQQKAEFENPEMKKQAGAIVSALTTFLPREGMFVEPDIPSKKLLNAKQSCQLPRYEHPVGLIDCTVMGSAKNGLVLGMKGIYYHNDWAGKKPGNAMVPYHTFAKHLFTVEGNEVVLGEGHFLNCTGALCQAGDVAGMLNAVGDALYPGRDVSGVSAEDAPETALSKSSSAVSKKSKDGGFFAPEKKGLEKGAIGGLVMMVIAVVWFVVGYQAGYIFYYPPVLFFIGLFGLIKGLLTGNISGNKNSD